MASTPLLHSPSRSATQTNSNDTMGSQLLEESAWDADMMGTNSMYPQDADLDLYGKCCYGHGDEREDGYEDEDDSMELSDVDAVPGHGHEQRDGDTVEDIMNLPGNKAPAVSVQDFGAFYPRDEAMSDEAKETKDHRELIEEHLRQQVLVQDDADEVAETFGDTEGYTDMDLAEAEESHGEDTEGVQALQEDILMHSLEEEEADASALEVNSARLTSMKKTPLTVHQSLEPNTDCSLHSTPSRNHVHRASDASPPRSTSFINFVSNPRAVVQTPNGIHIDFTSSATIPTQNYFNPIKATSPSKRRRKAASPEELAELAREAAVEEAEADEEAELRELEKYREMDLTPLEPVMESKTAGDLIVSGTPVKVRDEEVFGWESPTLAFCVLSSRPFVSAREAVVDLYGSTDVHHTPSSSRLTLLLEQDEDDDADVEESDGACDVRKKYTTLSPHHATFIAVVEMLPATIFWATVCLVTRYSIAAFDALIELLTGLKMEE